MQPKPNQKKATPQKNKAQSPQTNFWLEKNAQTGKDHLVQVKLRYVETTLSK